MDDSPSFGAWLHRRRKALDVTQAELADRAGCAVGTLKAIEGDARRPSRQLAARIADCLQLGEKEREAFVKAARGLAGADQLPAPNGSAYLEALPRTFKQRHNNLPAQLNALIGRQGELAELDAMLRDPNCRLVTIVGPGGIGKTRLALAFAAQQAERFADGAAFVSLAAVSSPAFVAPAILAALDVPAQGQRPLREQVLDVLCARELLLVLDNLEQLLRPNNGHSDDLAELLLQITQAAPGVTMLTTSRERLALPGEWLYDLDGLPYPADAAGEDFETFGAAQLFVQRARQVRPQYALTDTEALAVTRICQLVEGMPLAIELAASAMRARSSSAIADEIASGIAALTTELRALPERHRSIVATFEHSWRLLNDEERRVFAELSVFRGGFEREAAAAVAQATTEILAKLVDKSLLRFDGEARYDTHELVRQYGHEQLCLFGGAEEANRRHAAYFLTAVEAAEPLLLTAGRTPWLERLEREYANIRAALVWSRSATDGGEIGLRLIGSLLWFYMFRGYLSEGRAWIEDMLAVATVPNQPRVWANALYCAGMLPWAQNDNDAASARLTQSVQYWRETADKRGLAFALSLLGNAKCRQGDFSSGRALCAESAAIMRELGEAWGLAYALFFLANADRLRGDYDATEPLYEESITLWRSTGDLWGLAMPLSRLGCVAGKRGDYAMARRLIGEGLEIRRRVGQKFLVADSLVNLAEVVIHQGEPQQGEAYIAEALALYRELGVYGGVCKCIELAAFAAARRAYPERAARLRGAAQRHRDALHIVVSPGEQLRDERDVAAVRAQLGAAAFAAALAAGQALTLDEAIAEALAVSEPIFTRSAA